MRASSHAVHAFAVGAASGFLAGAALVALLLSGNREDVDPHRTDDAAWSGPAENGDAGERPPVPPSGKAGSRGAPVATTGDHPPVVAPPPSPEPVLDAPPAGELAGRDLLIPVAGVTSAQLTRSFSERRGAARQHEAIDILAPRHTPVLAVEGGTIARLFYSESGGITIYQFDPSERFCYYYAHLDRYAEGLTEGQEVRKGQLLGYVGVSGNAPEDTPHLHFAIFRLSSAKRWWEGTPLDPFDALQ